MKGGKDIKINVFIKKEMEDRAKTLDEKLKKIVGYGRFSNERYAIPDIVDFVKSLKEYAEETRKDTNSLAAKVEGAEKKSMSDTIKSVEEEIKKAVGKIGITHFVEYATTTKEGREWVRGLFDAHKDIWQESLKKVAEEKQGVFSTFMRHIRWYFLTVAGIETLLVTAGVVLGSLYVINKTPAGKFFIDQKRTEAIIKDFEAYKKENAKEMQEYSGKIDNFKKKYSDEFFNAQKKSIDDNIATSQKNLEDKLTSNYSSQIANLKSSYEEQTGNLKNEIASYKEFYEKLKADNESYKKSLDELNELKKTGGETANKIKELEDRISKNEKKYDGKIKKLEKAK
jgi:DNA repair exonuclease SbcCD ATPase subunit